jgi:hypothetical protein
MRWIAALLLTSTLASSMAAPLARAERPKEQGGGPSSPPAPTSPPSEATSPPPADPQPAPAPTVAPAPAPPVAPTIVVAPTVAPAGTVIMAPPKAQAGSTVITPQGVPIVIRNRAPDASIIEHRLVTVDGTVLGSCMGNCTFQVPPGTYVIQSGETDELRAGRQQIVASGPTMVDVEPGSKSSRTTGLVLGITGPVLFVVGFFGTFFVMVDRNVASDCDGGGPCAQDRPSYTPWVLSLVGGIAATTAGWVMFGTSGTRMKASPFAPAAIVVAPLLSPSTQGAALTVRF